MAKYRDDISLQGLYRLYQLFHLKHFHLLLKFHNNSLNDKYNDLYSEQKRLTQEVNNLKFKSKTHTYSNQVDNIDKSPKSIFLHLKSFFISVKKLIQNEKNKSAEERSKDLTALILTIIIVAIILFIFWRVPFLKKFLFP